LEAQLVTAMEGLQQGAVRLLQDHEVHPQLLILAEIAQERSGLSQVGQGALRS
jgi:hypothetical protein